MDIPTRNVGSEIHIGVHTFDQTGAREFNDHSNYNKFFCYRSPPWYYHNYFSSIRYASDFRNIPNSPTLPQWKLLEACFNFQEPSYNRGQFT